MAKRRFHDAERYAVYTVHGERCYMCHRPIDLMMMEVDHVIPETLLDDSAKLRPILDAFGLPADFDLQSFENWLPACSPCNKEKLDRVFNPTPLIQLHIEKAREKALEALDLSTRTVKDQAVSKAWNIITRAYLAGSLTENIEQAIKDFAKFHAENRVMEAAKEPMRLTPLVQVLKEAGGIRIVKGPYGVGGGPIGPAVHSSFICPTCGYVAWNGARCVVCGELNDD